MWNYEKMFVIYKVTEDGLLKHPLDKYGSNVFNRYGYETEEEAISEIEKTGNTANFVILQTISSIFNTK